MFVDPQPDATELQHLYPVRHQQMDPARYEIRDGHRRAKNILRLKRTGTASILDIGCGKGMLLNYLQAAGWKTCGLELSENSAATARRMGVQVYTVSLDKAPLDAAGYDVISLFHVLEHLPDPGRTLELLKPHFKPGGILVIEVPNAGSWHFRLLGPHWFHYDAPRHLYHFTPITLNRLLAAHGYTVVEQRHHDWQYDAFGLLQGGLNLVSGQPNLLNNVLTKETSFKEIARHPYRLLWLLVSLTVLIPGMILLMLLEWLLSPWVDGGTLRYVAKPPGEGQLKTE